MFFTHQSPVCVLFFCIFTHLLCSWVQSSLVCTRTVHWPGGRCHCYGSYRSGYILPHRNQRGMLPERDNNIITSAWTLLIKRVWQVIRAMQGIFGSSFGNFVWLSCNSLRLQKGPIQPVGQEQSPLTWLQLPPLRHKHFSWQSRP